MGLPYGGGLAARFVNIDYDTPLILPPNLRHWAPADHLAHFILDAVGEMDLPRFKVNHRGTGSGQYPPRRLLGLLLYGYATGLFSWRRLEQATYGSVPGRMICGDTHPDHDTICVFRRESQALSQETFVRVLEMAQALKFLQVGQITVAVDGTKVMAHARQHTAVSYEHAGKSIAQLGLEVTELLAKAERADSAPPQDGLSIPAEMIRRQERKAALAKARAEIEARAQARYVVALAEHEEKRAGRAAKQKRGERVGGKPPRAPAPEPGPKDQYNFTDPESRIMKAGGGQHFERNHNAQAAVEVDSRLIVGERVSPAPNDKQELVPTVAAVAAPVESIADVLTDSGFYSEAAVHGVEQTPEGQPAGTTVHAAPERKEHHRTARDLEKKEEPVAPAAGAKMSEVMKHRLKTTAGPAKYKLRRQTVEPVFGIIKSVMGFRPFLLRGAAKVGLEWGLVCTAYNLKRLPLMKVARAG
jgi:transposase